MSTKGNNNNNKKVKNYQISHNHNNQNQNEKRLLITVNVLGSAGPMRFVVKEDDLVGSVIDTALRSYAKEQRLPVMGTNSTDFLLYCATNAGSDALSPSAQIGSQGVRTFMLCKKRQLQITDRKSSDLIAQKGLGCWKSWLHNPFPFKLLSH